MTDQVVTDRPGGVCTSCNTRLRLIPRDAAEYHSECPECGASLVIRFRADGSASVSLFDTSAASSLPRKPAPSRSPHWWVENSRNIAATITVAGAIALAIMLMSSASESQQDSTSFDNAGAAPVQNNKRQPDKPTDREVQRKTSKSETSLPGSQTVSTPTVPALPVLTGNEQLSSGSATKDEARSRPDITVADLSELPVQLSLPSDSKASIATIGGTIDDSSLPNTIVAAATTAGSRPEKMSVSERLEISIRSFRQTKSVPLSDVIQTVEQMCRVQVDTSAASLEQLNNQLSLSLENTTPALILTEAGRKSGLRVIVDKDSVRMISNQD